VSEVLKNIDEKDECIKANDALKALEKSIASTTAKYQDAVAELEVLFKPEEDFEDFEDVEGSIELPRAEPVEEKVLVELERLNITKAKE
jgi:hypothetical protein